MKNKTKIAINLSLMVLCETLCAVFWIKSGTVWASQLTDVLIALAFGVGNILLWTRLKNKYQIKSYIYILMCLAVLLVCFGIAFLCNFISI